MEQGGPSNTNEYYVLKPWNVGKNGKGSWRMPIPAALTSGLRQDQPVVLVVGLRRYNGLEINVDGYGHFALKTAGWRMVVEGEHLDVGDRVLLRIQHLGKGRHSGVTFDMLVNRKQASRQQRTSSATPRSSAAAAGSSSAPPAPPASSDSDSSASDSSASDSSDSDSSSTGGGLSVEASANTDENVFMDVNFIDYDDSDYEPVETQVARTASDPIIILDSD